jgi:hypothetical protein
MIYASLGISVTYLGFSLLGYIIIHVVITLWREHRKNKIINQRISRVCEAMTCFWNEEDIIKNAWIHFYVYDKPPSKNYIHACCF